MTQKGHFCFRTTGRFRHSRIERAPNPTSQQPTSIFTKPYAALYAPKQGMGPNKPNRAHSTPPTSVTQSSQQFSWSTWFCTKVGVNLRTLSNPICRHISCRFGQSVPATSVNMSSKPLRPEAVIQTVCRPCINLPELHILTQLLVSIIFLRSVSGCWSAWI